MGDSGEPRKRVSLSDRLKRFLRPPLPPIPSRYFDKTDDPGWTISQERAVMEELVYKRLTLFLTIAGALITAAVALRGELEISVPLLATGTLLCWVLQGAVFRAQRKLDVILAILFRRANHPTGYINEIVQDQSRVKWVGYVVPRVLTLLLALVTLIEVAVLISRSVSSGAKCDIVFISAPPAAAFSPARAPCSWSVEQL